MKFNIIRSKKEDFIVATLEQFPYITFNLKKKKIIINKMK